MAFHETPFWEWLIQIIVGTIGPMSYYNLLVCIALYLSEQSGYSGSRIVQQIQLDNLKYG